MSRYLMTSSQHGVEVEVDLSSQVLELEVPPENMSPSPASLQPTLPGTRGTWRWAPALAFMLKAKAFDDGLYAAVELLAQKGTRLLPGKRRLLEQLHQVLRSRWSPQPSDSLKSALVLIQAALSMTGTLEEPDRKLRLLVMKHLKQFEADEKASKPLGFYTWNAQLQAQFKQDRLLQGELEPDVDRELLEALGSQESLRSAWRKQLQLACRLTNPLALPALDEEGEDRRFFPPSESHEGRLVKELFGTHPPAEGFELTRELISRIREGRLETTPTEHSGWYDRQFHAQASLLMPERMPEAERLLIGPRYRAELEQQFRALFALTRETHIKQLELAAAAGPPPLIIHPRLSIEPLAEFYRRRAEGYLFVRETLQELLGEPVLSHARRLTPEGPVEEPLLDELVDMEQLFRGAHAIVRQELGFGEVEQALLPAAMLARRWLRRWTEDPSLSQDVRCVVPLFFDESRRQTKVLAVLGFQHTEVVARFQRSPEVHLTGADGQPVPANEVSVRFGDALYATARPVTVELYVSRIPDRAGFRALCDTHGGEPTPILEALRG